METLGEAGKVDEAEALMRKVVQSMHDLILNSLLYSYLAVREVHEPWMQLLAISNFKCLLTLSVAGGYT